MDSLKQYKKLVADLNTRGADKEAILQSIPEALQRLQGVDIKDVLQGNKLLLHLAQVLDINITKWLAEVPLWVGKFLMSFFNLRGETDLFPTDQAQTLVNSCRNYIMRKGWSIMHVFHVLAGFASAQQILVQDDELLHICEREITRSQFGYFFGNLVSGGFEPGQKKLLENKAFILRLLSLVDTFDWVWDLLANISQHTDAKTLLPTKSILPLASKSTYVRCADVCTLLCSDDDLKTIKPPDGWVDSQIELLKSLITHGHAKRSSVSYSLLAIILPIANLSVVESYKDELGQKGLNLLLQVLTGTLMDIGVIQKHLLRSRQEAARAIWNLAYLETNCVLIKNGPHVEKLKQELGKTQDGIIKQNINGILTMCKVAGFEVGRSAEVSHSTASKKHIMLSYNWGNQDIVKRIAQTLKQHGYSIWLDIEQMEGSTLAAMADAVERSAVVLVCMSQKYKDSPNCRLEGEYCISTKVKILPLMMQKAYKPDGWLGITLGAKLWYDFSDDQNWEEKMQALIKALGEDGKGSQRHSPIRANHALPPSPQPPANKVTNWTIEDIHKWLKEEKLERHYEAFKRHKFDGVALAELKALQKPSFLKEVCREMGIEEMGEVLRISAAIRKL